MEKHAPHSSICTDRSSRYLGVVQIGQPLAIDLYTLRSAATAKRKGRVPYIAKSGPAGIRVRWFHVEDWSRLGGGELVCVLYKRNNLAESKLYRSRIQVSPELAEALGKQERALVLLLKHPEWSVAKIAKTIGCDRKTPYKWEKFRQAFKVSKSGRDALPRGEKSKGGDLEAW